VSAFRASRLARSVAVAVIVGLAIVNLYWAVTAWTLSDAEAYWNAGLRLREGGLLYPPPSSVDASDVYRYAPWFAWLAVPITFLPVQAAGALWSALLLAASGVALVPLARRGAWLALAFFAPILIGISAVGNVHALLIAALVHGVHRRSGPLWIALAASLKIFPILLVGVYAGRREWGRVAASLALTAVLWTPALWYDLRGYATDAGQAASLVMIPILWGMVIVGALVVTARLAPGRYAWLAGATAVAVSLPRLFVYDVTYLLLGATPEQWKPERRA
jgi:hypothetical protein